MDNWKNFNVRHPKKGLTPIKNLSSNEKGRAIVDLSHQVAEYRSHMELVMANQNALQLQYTNHIASITAMSATERAEVFGIG
jgi:hypothetical protein